MRQKFKTPEDSVLQYEARRFLTITEVAAKMKLNKREIRGLMRAGLPHIKITNQSILFDEILLDRWITERLGGNGK